jgi:hypothetical protein
VVQLPAGNGFAPAASRTWASLHDGDETAKGLGVESRPGDDPGQNRRGRRYDRPWQTTASLDFRGRKWVNFVAALNRPTTGLRAPPGPSILGGRDAVESRASSWSRR